MLDKHRYLGVIGVLIGSALSLIGNILTQYFSSIKEEKQWSQKRIAEKEDKEETQVKEEKAYLTDLYHNCVLSLSVFLSHLTQEKEDKNNIPPEMLKDIHKWLSLLSLKHSEKKFLGMIDAFLRDPDSYEAGQLRKYVLNLAKKENLLFTTEENNTVEEEVTNSRKIKFNIDEEYRKEMMKDAIELPRQIIIEYKLESISREHRERLLEIYFPAHKRIPEDAYLYVPMHNHPNAPQIFFQGKQWEARIDPSKYDTGQILDMWVNDFDEKLDIAKASLEAKSKHA